MLGPTQKWLISKITKYTKAQTKKQEIIYLTSCQHQTNTPSKLNELHAKKELKNETKFLKMLDKIYIFLIQQNIFQNATI